MKKLMVTCFMLCMIGVLLPDITAKAAMEGDYEYTVLEDDTVEITKYNGKATTLTIPDTLGGKPVTRIADMAFHVQVEVKPGYYVDASTVTSVVFPETLTYIGNWNFYQLTSIHIPASVTTIGSRAFGMEHVESITVDENNAVYDSRENCNAIIWQGIDEETGVNKVELVLGCNTSVVPDGVTRIGSDAFSGCTFESINIPTSVMEIGYCAFYGSELKEINLSNGVTSIGGCAFMNCKNLETVSLPDSVKVIGDWAFENCSNLTNITIPNGVTTIGSEAFAGCSKLEEIIIPASVTAIGAGAFVDCSRIVVDENNEVYDSRDNCNAVILKEGMYEYWDEPVSDFLITGCKNTTIPSSVTAIGARAFMNCSGLTNIGIPESVTYIDDAAFSHCTGLTSIEIPKSVSSMGEGVFNSCTNLTNIIIPSDLDYINDYMFSGCTSLESITIPEGIRQICSEAFEGCINLKGITIPSTVTSIGESAFADCTSLTDIILPSGMEEISCNTFENCTSLTEVEIPDGVIDIYSSAFTGCSALKSVIIPASVEDISEDAFAECPTSMVVYTDLGTYAEQWVKEKGHVQGYVLPQENCKVKILSATSNPTVAYTEATDKGATKITVPNQVTIGEITYKVVEIADDAFSGCTALEEVVLPEMLEKIGSEAFEGVTEEGDETKLKLTIPEELEEVSGIGIENITNIKYIIIYVVDGGKAENYFQTFNYITINVYPPQQPSTDNEQPPADTQQPPADTQQPPADTSQPSSETQETAVVGKQYTVKNLNYKVTSSKNVMVVGVAKKKITQVTIPAKVTILGKSFKVTELGKKAFKKCSKLKTVVIGSNVKTIGDEAFMKCTKLKKITIGKNVKTIGKKAFYGDKKLKNIVFKGTKVTKIGKKAMKGVSGVKVKVPNNKAKNKYTKLLKKAK